MQGIGCLFGESSRPLKSLSIVYFLILSSIRDPKHVSTHNET